LSENYQRQSCSTINYLSIRILAGDDPVPVKSGPKGTYLQLKGCAFHVSYAVHCAAIADLLVQLLLLFLLVLVIKAQKRLLESRQLLGWGALPQAHLTRCSPLDTTRDSRPHPQTL